MALEILIESVFGFQEEPTVFLELWLVMAVVLCQDGQNMRDAILGEKSWIFKSTEIANIEISAAGNVMDAHAGLVCFEFLLLIVVVTKYGRGTMMSLLSQS